MIPDFSMGSRGRGARSTDRGIRKGKPPMACAKPWKKQQKSIFGDL